MIANLLTTTALLGMMASAVGCSSSSKAQQAEPVPAGGTKTLAESKDIKFPSGATVKIPEGMTGELAGTIATFAIGTEPLDIHIAEYKSPLAEALLEAKKALYPEIVGKKPVHTMDPPGGGKWDVAKVEIFGPDDKQRYIQIEAKQKAAYTWVMLIRGDKAVLAKRAAQINTLNGNLKVPGQKTIDLSGRPLASITKSQAQLDSFVKDAMAKVKIPGLAIAVIENGKVAYKAGYGQLAMDNSAPVTPETMFMIGSTTKSLTTLMISKLADQGVLSWDDKMTSLYPPFKLGDAELTAKATLADLACACTGVPRRDLPLIFNHKGKKAKDLLAELRYLKPTTKHKETFQYNNQLVAASGFIAANKATPDLAGEAAYEQQMTELVFEPLAMSRTTTSGDKAASMTNVAKSHVATWDGDVSMVDAGHERFAEYVGPSGGVWSTVTDMANYMLAEVNGGMFAGKRIVSEQALLKRRAPQVRIDGDSHYGLGWMVGKSLGLDLVQHDGLTIGFSSGFVFWPKHRSGLIVLSNSRQGVAINQAIIGKLLELWFNEPLKAEQKLDAVLKMEKQGMADLKRMTFKLTDGFIKPFLGKHYHPEMGEMEILAVDGKYQLRSSGGLSELTGFFPGQGTKKLMTISGELLGVVIDPVFKDDVSIQIALAQEVYPFKRLAR